MKIFEIDPLRDPRWNAFLDSRSDASVFHRTEWLQALKACYGYESIALSSSPPGIPLADGLVYCAIKSRLTGNRFVSVPFSDHCEPLVNDPEQVDWFIQYAADKIVERRWKYLEIRPIDRVPASLKTFAICNSYWLHRLDITCSEECLLKGFHNSVLRKIRRAERERLRYETGSSEALLRHFYRLLIRTRRRHRLPPQPLEWFRGLIASIGDNLKVRLAFKGDIPVASILTISDKKTVVYKYGCSDEHFANLGGTALLWWNTITEAKAHGIQELDLGRTDIDNQGLMTYKDHWGARRSTINYWRYPVATVAFRPESAIKYADRLISIVPDASLVLLGRLLYRHIG
jgi:CelD/BcsL family acetyltransferase involved in cellulose biosynthesis